MPNCDFRFGRARLRLAPELRFSASTEFVTIDACQNHSVQYLIYQSNHRCHHTQYGIHHYPQTQFYLSRSDQNLLYS